MELLKNYYNDAFFEGFSKALDVVLTDFNKKAFLDKVFESNWDDLELKQRMRHLSTILKEFLSPDYKEAIKELLSLVEYVKVNQKKSELQYMLLPDFIHQYGIDHPELSIKAMEELTQYVTCEFAVRPFIIQYPELMMNQMLSWTTHPNKSVRRFASEGCRPRLPWAMGLPDLKNDPAPILPILETLKDDESEFVRKSVANNLNDISKDHPELIIKLVKKWKGKSEKTDWLLKHASRTLLKEGNTEIMSLFGFDSINHIIVKDLEILNSGLRVGDYLNFNFTLINKEKSAKLLRLEYGIYHLRSNGSQTRKVFKISEKNYNGQSSNKISRKHSFKPISTRRYYPGQQQVSIIINGNEVAKEEFELSV